MPLGATTYFSNRNMVDFSKPRCIYTHHAVRLTADIRRMNLAGSKPRESTPKWPCVEPQLPKASTSELGLLEAYASSYRVHVRRPFHDGGSGDGCRRCTVAGSAADCRSSQAQGVLSSSYVLFYTQEYNPVEASRFEVLLAGQTRTTRLSDPPANRRGTQSGPNLQVRDMC